MLPENSLWRLPRFHCTMAIFGHFCSKTPALKFGPDSHNFALIKKKCRLQYSHIVWTFTDSKNLEIETNLFGFSLNSSCWNFWTKIAKSDHSVFDAVSQSQRARCSSLHLPPLELEINQYYQLVKSRNCQISIGH